MDKPKKIAIVGAGLAGLSLAYKFSSNPSYQIDIYDPKPREKRASSRAFLLHSFIHPKCLLNWRGREAFKAAEDLMLSVHQKSTLSFFKERPFLKLANHPKLVSSFKEAALLYPEVSFEEKTFLGYPGVWINQAYQIEGALYLKALEVSCQKQGAMFINTLAQSLNQYDLIFYASGHEMLKMFPSFFEGFTPIKGQILELKKPKEFELNHAISAYKCHLFPSMTQETLFLASTYERQFIDELPQKETALNRLLPKLNFLPDLLQPSDVLSVQSGVRLYAPDKMPKCLQINERSWGISALGSKGLLYHAYLAELFYDYLEKNLLELPRELTMNKATREEPLL